MFLIGLLGFTAPLIGLGYVRALEWLIDSGDRRVGQTNRRDS